MERTLAVMCGAGVLPALVAERARAERWRVVAFAFDGATDLSERVARTIPSHIREFGPILTGLKDEGVSAAVLAGRFPMTDVLQYRTSMADEAALSLQGRAGSRIDSRLVDAIIALGCVIRGATAHFEYVSSAATSGCSQVATSTGVPVIFGVLTTDSIEQAIERAGTKAGNKGAEAAIAALEMASLLRSLVDRGYGSAGS